MSAAFWFKTGSLFAGLAVVTGAFAAHGLDKYLQAQYADQTRVVTGEEISAAVKYLRDFKTAATYQMYHSLALLAVGLMGLHGSSGGLQVAGWSFLTGILIFSGTLYLLVLMGPRWLGVPWGAITPIGGVAFLVGWASLLLTGLPFGQQRSSANR